MGTTSEWDRRIAGMKYFENNLDHCIFSIMVYVINKIM